MNHALRFTAAKIGARLDLIRPLIHRRTLDLPPFRLVDLGSAAEDPPVDGQSEKWTEVPPESYWGRADLNFYMSSSFAVPDGWDPGALALYLPLGTMGDIFNHPEALVLIDRRPVASADRYHHTIALSPAIADGGHHLLGLHGWTGHTQWPPDPTSKAKLFMGRPALVERDLKLLDFVRLAEATLDTAKTIGDGPDEEALLDALDAAFLALNTRAPLEDAFRASVQTARDTLTDAIAEAGQPLDVTLHGIGHAHMDIAYLWPIDQIRRKNARTYSNVLRLMEADPDYRFSHSQPALYEMCERDYPEIFDGIRACVADGRWEPMGGMWVEPDLNLSGPEALVRQLQLGRRWFRDRFGDRETPVLWLPDTFGFPGQIPQLMTKAGLKWFCTNKLNWNQATKVPPTHLWEGIDGTRVLAQILTTPRDVQYLPFPTNYKSDLSAREVLGTVHRGAEDARHLPIVYGYGDGGGGPTERLLARARIFASMPGMPRMKMSSVRAMFEAIEAEARDLPVHFGEHYMEGHRGVFTSQAWIKRANRRNEAALHEAEALAVMARMSPDLNAAWRLLCLNQFHDIITGTSVPAVFEDARRDHARIAEIAEEAAHAAALALADRAGEALVLNTSPVASDRILELPLDEVGDAPHQPLVNTALVYLPDLPPYSATPLAAAARPAPDGLTVEAGAEGATLENAMIRVAVDPSGRVTSLFDKTNDRECLASDGVGNQLQAFEDRPICWDAWDIDPTIGDRMDLVSEPASLTVVEAGPLRASVRLTFAWRNSHFRQDIRLSAHSARVDFATQVDWHERHTLLKVAFPVSCRSDTALYDTQWGVIARPTTRDTPTDFAKFEVPARKWAALSNGTHGVALLNDCKYGYDIEANRMRLTLIKSSTAPDPEADQGRHELTYSILPLGGDDRSGIDRAAYDMNLPLRFVLPEAPGGKALAPVPTVRADGKRIIPETLMPLDRNDFVLRLFEPDGASGKVHLAFGSNVTGIDRCNLLDDTEETLNVKDGTVSLDVAPFEIVSLRIRRRDQV